MRYISPKNTTFTTKKVLSPSEKTTLNERTSLLQTSDRKTEGFDFTQEEIEFFIHKMILLYQPMEEALEEKNVKRAIEILGEYASIFFVELYKKKKTLDFLCSYRLIVEGFMECVHEYIEIDEKNLLEKASENALIFNIKLCRYVLEIQDKLFDPSVDIEASSDLQKQFIVKMFIITPFITSFFPISHEVLQEFKKKDHLNLSEPFQYKTNRAILNHFIPNPSPFEEKVLLELQQKLTKIQTRLENNACSCMGFFNKNPREKIKQIQQLHSLLKKTTTTIELFDHALKNILENKSISHHRNWIKRNMLSHFFKAPKIVHELKQLRDFYREADQNPYLIFDALVTESP